MKIKNRCNICGSDTNLLFQTKVLFKYDTNFHKCNSCGFIQTDIPFWLDEAYKNAITSLDIGLTQRNIVYSKVVEYLLKTSFDYNGQFLDYASGFGMFVRLMRDKGFDFYWDDKYCENIFVQHFTLEEIGGSKKFEAVTCFEVFEHIPNPLEEIEKLFSFSDTIIFSTELVPDKEIRSVEDWWYMNVDAGQHISFYTKKSFEVIANKFNCFYYTNNRDLHILTRKQLNKDPLKSLYKTTKWDKIANKLIRVIEKTKNDYIPYVPLKSRLQSDYIYIKNKGQNK